MKDHKSYISSRRNTAPRVEQWDINNFCKPRHSNVEFQITLFQRGRGLLFFSNKVVDYKEGDLFFFGKNAPYIISSSKADTERRISNPLKAISLFFDTNKLKSSLNCVPEADRILKFIDFSEHGVKVSEKLTAHAIVFIHELNEKNGLERLLLFLKFLDLVSKDKSGVILSAKTAPKLVGDQCGKKLLKVYEFIAKNHQEIITLEQISDTANMSPTGFCRFFKIKTNKTFSRYLAEVRIGTACELLHSANYNVSDCCYNSGFNNMSNFHKQFKNITGMSPTEYRMRFRKSEQSLTTLPK